MEAINARNTCFYLHGINYIFRGSNHTTLSRSVLVDNIMRWETSAGIPTPGLLFAQISEKLRELQELTAMMGHVQKVNDNELVGQGWLGISEMMKLTLHNVTKLAKRGLQ